MAATIKCDGCGREAPMVHYPNGTPGWHKPHDWYQREDEDGTQDACSRPCIEKIAKATPHTDILALLAKSFPQRVPKDVDCTLTYRPEADEYWWDTVELEEGGIVALFYDAHAHIELAAWKAVRVEADKMGFDAAMSAPDPDVGVTVYGIKYTNEPPEMRTRYFGSGPDDATALLAALTHITENQLKG